MNLEAKEKELLELINNDFKDNYKTKYDSKKHSYYISPSLSEYARILCLTKYDFKKIYKSLQRSINIKFKHVEDGNHIAIYLV